MTTRPHVPATVDYSQHNADAGLRLRGGRLIAARSAWCVLVVLAVLVFVVVLPVSYQASRSVLVPETRVPGQLAPADVLLLQQWGLSLDTYAAYQTALMLVFGLIFIGAGAMLFRARSDDRFVLLVSSWFVLFSLTGSPMLDPLIRAYPAWQLPVRFLQGASIGCFSIFTFLFPDGRFVPRWTRGVTYAWITWIVIAPFTPYMIADFTGASALWFAVLVPGGLLLGIVAQVYRYRRVSSRLERQQARWVLLGVAVLAVSIVVYSLLPLMPAIREPGLTRVLYIFFSETVFLVLPFSLLPLCIGVAILRYQLWDIDYFINRTLVYGALSAGVVAIYVLLVGTLGAVFQSSGSVVVGLLATGLAAALVHPMRARLQRGVNRLMYGERDDPYAVLSGLSRQLKHTLSPDAVLPGIAASLARTLKLPYVAITLAQDSSLEVAASYGRPAADQLRLPLVYQAEVVGELLVAPRAPGEAFTPAERRLLDDIALHAGVAAHAVRLTAALQRSRERLITAREEERRRLRRDLHDGLGPQLASLSLTLAAARELLRHDADAADGLLRELGVHTQAAIADIRRVVYALRPPALDDLGLLPALREQAAHYSQAEVAITIAAPEPLPPLPAAVEVAAYRIVQEALTNVVRHARAGACEVRLELDDALTVQITDDGAGLPPGGRTGVGLASMRERAEELGGTCRIEAQPGRGTTIRAQLPLHQEGAWTPFAS